MPNTKPNWQPSFLLSLAIYLAAGGLIADLVWIRDSGIFLLLALFPLSGLAGSRERLAAVWVGYYLSGSRSIISAVEGYYPDMIYAMWLGLGLWLLSAITLSLPWIILRLKPSDTLLRWTLKFLLTILMICLPPIGLWGWLFPGLFVSQITSGYGVTALFIGLIVAGWIVWLSYRNRPTALIAIFMITLISMLLPSPPLPEPPPGLAAGSTKLGGWPANNEEMTRRQIDLLNVMMDLNDILPAAVKHVVLPESVAGPWVKGMDQFWGLYGVELAQRSGRTYYIGSEVPIGGTERQGALIAIAPSGVTEIAVAMQPIPIASWHPWKEGGTTINWDRTNVVQFNQVDYAIMFCYEEVIVLSFVKYFLLSKPQAILSIANAWWSEKSGAAAIQERHTKAWAVLFSVPYIRATNR